MKRQKKWGYWTGLVAITVVAVFALLAAFVPINTKNGKYVSFFGGQTYSSNLTNRMTATYTYETEGATLSKAKEACQKIQKFLQGKGYVSAAAKAVGNNKIEVSLSKPTTGDGIQDALTLLGSYGVGVGSFEIKTSTDSSKESLIVGSKHVKNVSVTSSNGYYYTVVKFTKEGVALINASEAAALAGGSSNSYYLFFGGSTEITGSHAFTYTNNFIDDNLYIGGVAAQSAAEQYKLLCEMGSLPVSLNSANITDIVYEGGTGANHAFNTAQIVLWSFCLFVLVAYLLLIAIRHGVFAYVAAFLANAIVLPIALLLFVAMDFVELYGSSIAVIAICIGVLNALILAMFDKMRANKKMGKDKEMSIDSGYSKSILPSVVLCSTMFFVGLIAAIAFSGALQSAATIIAVFGVLSGLAVLTIVKWVFVALGKILPNNRITTTWEDAKND